MAKILTINPETISIGMDNGELKDVPADAVMFVPHVGDEVEIFESANKIIVSKVDVKPPVDSQPASQATPNIIINNSNNNVNSNVNKNTNTNTVPVSTAPVGKQKNKWVALILCLCLGMCGAHKFYDGKIGMGILYIFTLGLCGVGVIIDIIQILGRPNPYYV